jgi:pimeloyl-ACP methyl ester carboxylesterase
MFGPDDSQTDDRGLLFIHGYGSDQSGYFHRAGAASDALGIRCLTFDLSGHGPDAADLQRYSVYDHLRDVVAVYDYLAATARSVRLGACGASYGAYLGVLLSEHRPVQRLLLRAPAVAGNVDFPDAEQVPVPEDLGKRPGAFDSLKVLSRFSGGVLVLESEFDEVIPHSQVAAYLDACIQAEHEVIAGAKHALSEPAWDSVFTDAIIRWFRDL